MKTNKSQRFLYSLSFQATSKDDDMTKNTLLRFKLTQGVNKALKSWENISPINTRNAQSATRSPPTIRTFTSFKEKLLNPPVSRAAAAVTSDECNTWRSMMKAYEQGPLESPGWRTSTVRCCCTRWKGEIRKRVKRAYTDECWAKQLKKRAIN